jgi:hypothetical protein
MSQTSATFSIINLKESPSQKPDSVNNIYSLKGYFSLVLDSWFKISNSTIGFGVFSVKLAFPI